jgi:hypothetical protein
MWFEPRLNARPFQCFFSIASGFGTIGLRGRTVWLRVIEGELNLERIVYTDHESTRTLEWKVTVHPGAEVQKEV